jgi:hypothetical protein
VLVGALLALLALWWTDPTPTTLSQYVTSLQERTPSQLHNIRRAVQSLDGVYIMPATRSQEQAEVIFSFNQVVGPRSLERGYVPAPVFMVAETLDSVGGGICQVSSSLYNAASVGRAGGGGEAPPLPAGRVGAPWLRCHRLVRLGRPQAAQTLSPGRCAYEFRSAAQT